VCWVPCATAAGPSVSAGVLTNASSDVCPPAPVFSRCVHDRCHTNPCTGPCCFRFTTRTVHVSAMRRGAVPSGLKQMAQIELRKINRMANLRLTNTSHAVTLLRIRGSGICSRLNVFWDSERLDIVDFSVTVLL
jgi:hypothetical protein